MIMGKKVSHWFSQAFVSRKLLLCLQGQMLLVVLKPPLLKGCDMCWDVWAVEVATPDSPVGS